ncbi:cell division cycle 14 [Entomortierella parvispora]|uniref:protein-tyrosine-phosphatase n=1 Tax=Entomortierella parvispora TaxID=205924 RepID=A0A9P3HH00_9FUNG|nr:cell division cycle 14 [Entomortierella parvispora]
MPPTLSLKRHDYEDETLSMANLKEATSATKLTQGAAHSTSLLAGRKHPSTPPPPSNPVRSWNRSHAAMQTHGIKLFKNEEDLEKQHEPMEWANEWDHGHRDTTTTTRGERAAALWDKVGGGGVGTVQGVAHSGPKSGSLGSVAMHVPRSPRAQGSPPTSMSNRGAHSQRGSDRRPSYHQGMLQMRGGHQRRRSVLDDVDREAPNVCEFMEDRLYFMWTNTAPISTSRTTYLTIDKYLTYMEFCHDFGPFNIADVFRFCCLMKERMEIAAAQGKILCLHTKPNDKKRANAAFAMSCYMMLLQNKTPEEAYAPIEYVHPPFTPYRDAADCPAHYTLSILDCLRGLRKGLDLGLLRLDQFDVKEYEHYERVVNGDFNWITPFFIAFAGPKDPMTRARLVELQARAAQAAAEAAAEGREATEEETTSEESSSSTLSSLASTRSNTPSPIQSSAGSSRISTPFITSSVMLPADQPRDCPLSSSLQASSIHSHHEDSKIKAPSPLSSSITSGSPEEDTVESYSNSASAREGKEEHVLMEGQPVVKKIRKKRTRLQKSFQSLLDYFEQKAKVHTVIRLNAPTYDKNHFLARGMQHMDMIFADGTNPPWSIVELFLEVSEEVIQFKQGVVAVHCMAGLGRTGTLIGAYLMRHFDMTAREVIAFLRLMRPGSVVGPQQSWLAENEWRLRGMQVKMEERMFGKAVARPPSPTNSLKSALQTPATDYDAVFSRASSAGLEPPANVIEGGSITLLDSDETASSVSSTSSTSSANASSDVTSEDTDDSDNGQGPGVIDPLDTIAVDVISDSANDFELVVNGIEAIPIQPRKHDDSHHNHRNHHQHHHHLHQ